MLPRERKRAASATRRCCEEECPQPKISKTQIQHVTDMTENLQEDPSAFQINSCSTVEIEDCQSDSEAELTNELQEVPISQHSVKRPVIQTVPHDLIINTSALYASAQSTEFSSDLPPPGLNTGTHETELTIDRSVSLTPPSSVFNEPTWTITSVQPPTLGSLPFAKTISTPTSRKKSAKKTKHKRYKQANTNKINTSTTYASLSTQTRVVNVNNNPNVVTAPAGNIHRQHGKKGKKTLRSVKQRQHKAQDTVLSRTGDNFNQVAFPQTGTLGHVPQHIAQPFNRAPNGTINYQSAGNFTQPFQQSFQANSMHQSLLATPQQTDTPLLRGQHHTAPPLPRTNFMPVHQTPTLSNLYQNGYPPTTGLTNYGTATHNVDQFTGMQMGSQGMPMPHQPSDSSEDSDDSSSSDDEDTLTRIGSNHTYQLCNMPIEGISMNYPQIQYAEPISTPISAQIPHKLKKKIWRNQFVDLAALLPRSYSTNTNFSLQLSAKSLISLVPNQAIKKIFNIESWTTAFLRFIAIYVEKFPMEAGQLLKYVEIVRDLARRSHGMSWYVYDQQFRMLRETVPIPWGRLHTEFWVMASNLPTQRATRQSFRPYRSNRSNNQTKKFLEKTCWNYNRRGFCGDHSCTFQHKCGYCRGQHSAQNCSQQSRKLQPNTAVSSKPNTTISSTNSRSTANPAATTHQRSV